MKFSYRKVTRVSCLLPMFGIVASAGCRIEEPGNAGDAKFQAYLEVTGRSGEQDVNLEQLRGQYEEKLALAAAILDSGAIDRRLIDAEVENYRTELVLKRYFDLVLGQALSEANLREYYRMNGDQFGRTRLRYSTFASTDTSDQSTQKLLQAVRAGEAPGEVATQLDLAVADDSSEMRYIDTLDPELQTLFRNKKKGDVIGPLVSSGLVTVYRIEDGPILEGQSFDEARQQILFILRNEIRARETRRLLSGSETR